MQKFGRIEHPGQQRRRQPAMASFWMPMSALGHHLNLNLGMLFHEPGLRPSHEESRAEGKS